MVVSKELPENLAAKAQRRNWYARAEADKVLDWIEDSGQRFLGVDVAQKQEDGTWMLLLDNLDLSRQTENFEAVRRGRQFVAEYDGKGRMFAPVWQDRGE
ncbi:hypothetical protein KUW15_09805 [Qipengyuania aquimaris]|uniref:hypothetical protein n=1 Tax=Qipengyuania aquimaris TaxID=255984 RepID=UPI001C9625F5|nr:hypothetical protein [Qipengyuania aquimaris]MBY6129010.1 hypothetical protein [Qipengyuania aquimaris]